jgi:hypothetical protein
MAIYFLGVSFGVIFPLSQPIHSPLDVIVSPILPFTLVGLVGVLIPFYNIHRTLLSPEEKRNNYSVDKLREDKDT